MPYSSPDTGSVNWLGFHSPYFNPVSQAAVGSSFESTRPLHTLLAPRGDTPAREPTTLWLWRTADTLHVKARCETAAMDRVRTLAARTTPQPRDTWGYDAIELQIDVNRTRSQYCHFILPPDGHAITYRGFSNRQKQGWHPSFHYTVTLEPDAWTIEAAFPFATLGHTPADGDTWGFNVMRVNANEPGGYVQWAPTFGEALCPERFGIIQFAGTAGDRPTETAAYARRTRDWLECFRTTINGIREPDALQALGIADWSAWGDYIARRPTPLPVRWDDVHPGREGIPANDIPMLMRMTQRIMDTVPGWTQDPPDPAAFSAEPLEVLGDAYLLTGDRRYVEVFERALQIHARRTRMIMEQVDNPHALNYKTNPYHDSQIVRAEMLAYTYLNMRQAGLSPETHAAMMWTILRSCRFAAFNISGDYHYGNHQMYESGGLGAVAALFPEFPENDAWAQVASRSIRLHLERELYPDGGYRERCGYHSVAMSFAMHAVATIRANHVESRFPDLMNPDTLGRMEHMHDWDLAMLTPDGSMPAFGDCGANTHLRFMRRGSAIFNRADLAWPLRQLAPALIPADIEPRQPDYTSVSLDSHFTVMRDGWSPDAFYLAIDHGPLGGQHSHLDTLGFVAYAHGKPLALDSGIGVSYEDPRYVTWFRSLRAHNIIVIGDIEGEKVAERRFWNPGPDRDIAGFRSHAYEHALGVIQDRTIHFIKGLGWFIHDRLTAPKTINLAEYPIEWLLHTPYDLKPAGSGILQGADAEGGLLVVAGNPDALEAPRLEKLPSAYPLPENRAMRLWDIGRQPDKPDMAQRITPSITNLTWRRKPQSGHEAIFAMFLLPYRGAAPTIRLTETKDGWTLHLNQGQPIHFPDKR